MQHILRGRMNYPRAFALSLGLVLDDRLCRQHGHEGQGHADKNMAHVHIGHVLTGWNDTPDKMGLLPTAIAEANVAAQHAGFALSKTDDLAWMKTHIGHILHRGRPERRA